MTEQDLVRHHYDKVKNPTTETRTIKSLLKIRAVPRIRCQEARCKVAKDSRFRGLRV